MNRLFVIRSCQLKNVSCRLANIEIWRLHQRRTSFHRGKPALLNSWFPLAIVLTTPLRDLFDTLIRIEVGTGEDKRTIEVFKGVLCFYSGYFNASLSTVVSSKYEST